MNKQTLYLVLDDLERLDKAAKALFSLTWFMEEKFETYMQHAKRAADEVALAERALREAVEPNAKF